MASFLQLELIVLLQDSFDTIQFRLSSNIYTNRKSKHSKIKILSVCSFSIGFSLEL